MGANKKTPKKTVIAVMDIATPYKEGLDKKKKEILKKKKKTK